MSLRRTKQQVEAILDSNQIPWSWSEERFAMRFASTMVFVGFIQVGAQTIITLHAPVLQHLNLDAARASIVLASLNDLNRSTRFGKWTLYEEQHMIGLEYDLLGDHLQEDELLTALATLARQADQQDDLLQDQHGGQRAIDS